MAVMGHPEPQRVTTAALLDRLREMLVELESGRRTGLDLLFGVAPERDGSWLLYERDLPRVRRVQDRHGRAWNLMNENLWKENDPADSQDCQQVRLNLVAGGI